ncbi:hypothetical protein F2Q70_00018268 [Brassica cretica]|uniref:Uncharacterized protein n=1 Tax=Brassica cretica TaxID=69181 RepID=A0A8S9HX25_BRACR|nr:hypothetical protein F2Q70_00018268 [Brassica cretica]KAF2599239.1 hypothetical protein F2Q68_00011479 [Brassica cretica]
MKQKHNDSSELFSFRDLSAKGRWVLSRNAGDASPSSKDYGRISIGKKDQG